MRNIISWGWWRRFSRWRRWRAVLVSNWFGQYTILVGNGGSGATCASAAGSQGYKSIIKQGSTDFYICRGGGGGVMNFTQAPYHTVGDVASFGGSGHDFTTAQSGTNYTSDYGKKGGISSNSFAGGGGGGGSSQEGQNSTLISGLSSQIAATPYYRGGIGGNGTYFLLTNSYFCGGGTEGANKNSGGFTLNAIVALGGGGAGSLAPM